MISDARLLSVRRTSTVRVKESPTLGLGQPDRDDKATNAISIGNSETVIPSPSFTVSDAA
jgi:hypothetical protein